jgi:N-acetylmuramic acid 6-phosphate etherase
MTMPAEALLLGIDGGATKTIVCLATSSAAGRPAIIGRGVAGPSNPQAVRFDRVLENLDSAIATAFEEAGIPPETAAAAVLGLAGSDREENRRVLTEWADKRRLARRLRIVHDGLPVLAAGTPDGWGIALISGTGSFAFGQGSDGRSCRAGGWGFLLGDEGSGYAIARSGLRAAAQAAEGRGPATRLLGAFLAHFQVRTPLELIRAVSPLADDRAAIAEMAELVIRAADENDAVSAQILDQAAEELTAMVAAVARRLDITRAFPLALAGGVLLSSERLRGRLQAAMLAQQLRADPTSCVVDPVIGALKLAQREIGKKQHGAL